MKNQLLWSTEVSETPKFWNENSDKLCRQLTIYYFCAIMMYLQKPPQLSSTYTRMNYWEQSQFNRVANMIILWILIKLHYVLFKIILRVIFELLVVM